MTEPSISIALPLGYKYSIFEPVTLLMGGCVYFDSADAATALICKKILYLSYNATYMFIHMIGFSDIKTKMRQIQNVWSDLPSSMCGGRQTANKDSSQCWNGETEGR